MKTGNVVLLIEGRDFTPAKLRDHLNAKFGTKVTGKPFTKGDIQQYEMYGKIPPEYGGHTVRAICCEVIGIKVLRIKKKDRNERLKKK